jgi:hypothetical protein
MGPWDSVAAHKQERGGAGRPGASPATGKSKKRTGADLKRLANLRENPFAGLAVDAYDEDRTRIGWLTVQDRAESSIRSNAMRAARRQHGTWRDSFGWWGGSLRERGAADNLAEPAILTPYRNIVHRAPKRSDAYAPAAGPCNRTAPCGKADILRSVTGSFRQASTIQEERLWTSRPGCGSWAGTVRARVPQELPQDREKLRRGVTQFTLGRAHSLIFCAIDITRGEFR